MKAERIGATSKCIDRGTACETVEYRNYPLEYQYFGTGKGEAVRLGRELEGCGRGTGRLLYSRRKLGREKREYVRPRTIFKRVGGGVGCGHFHRFKGSGIFVSFSFFTVTFGVGGVYTGVAGRNVS